MSIWRSSTTDDDAVTIADSRDAVDASSTMPETSEVPPIAEHDDENEQPASDDLVDFHIHDQDDDHHRGYQSSNHLHPHHHQHHHSAHLRALNGAHRGRGQFGAGYESIGGSGSFGGGSDVGTSSKSEKRPVIRYLPSAGGVKKLGLAAVASESVVTGSELRRSHLNGTAGQNRRPHKPGVVYQVASDFILERNLGFDLSHKPIALHEVASETAMALKTGHCKLHRDCSLQAPSWQNLCVQQQQNQSSYHPKEEEDKGSKTPSFSFANQEGKGVLPVNSNTTIDALTGSMMSVSLFPFCRICHMAASDSDEPLISPCRCSGTMQYIHGSCLMKWMDICSRKSRKTQRCELCHYQYCRQKRFQFKEWKMPRSSRRDKMLHAIFLLNLIIMIGCAVATVYCFLSDTGMPKRPRFHGSHLYNQGSSSSQGILLGSGGPGSGAADGGGVGVKKGGDDDDDDGVEMTSDGLDATSPSIGRGSTDDGSSSSEPRAHGRVDLSSEEVVTLCCGVLFFISFFVAMYAQIKAKHTLYQLFVRFTVLNTKWEIEEYNPANDPLLMSMPEKIGKEPIQSPVMV